jgi:hypothetical protein
LDGRRKGRARNSGMFWDRRDQRGDLKLHEVVGDFDAVASSRGKVVMGGIGARNRKQGEVVHIVYRGRKIGRMGVRRA